MKNDRPIQEFLAEAEDILESANQTLLAIEEGQASGSASPDRVNALFRAIHSFKGLSGMFGLQALAGLSHKLEFLLDDVRLGKVELAGACLEAVADTLGMLERMVQQAGKGQPAGDISNALACIDGILAGRSDAAPDRSLLSLVAIDPQLLQVLTEYEEHRLQENIRARNNLFVLQVRFSFADFEKGIRNLTETLKRRGEVICTLPTAGTGDGIGFTLLLGSAESQESLSAGLADPAVSIEPVPRSADALLPEPGAGTTTLRTVSKTVRVSIEKLDSLMSAVGELHIVKGEIARIAAELRGLQGFLGLAVGLTKAYKNLERRLNEIQEGLLDVRMVPIGQIFTRLAQAVRTYARDAGKEIDLEIFGEETELDKLMIEDLADPLMHLIRNAIDHGIDLPEMRKQLGKPERGRVRLTAAPRGNHVVVTVEDDGRGIDPRTILAKALEKKLVGPEANLDPVRDRKEVLDLIFQPGFTTSETVTEISGRGVGMDVVRRNVSRLSGMIDIDTEVGAGTVFTLTLPITLVIIKALIIESGGRRFAVPLSSVLEILRVKPGQIETIESREVMAIRDETVPLLRLTEAFGLQAGSGQEQPFVILVGLAERRLGLVVEALRGQQEIVIKPLGKRLAEVPGIAGATELGDKRVILVLDVESLVERAIKRTAASSQ
jgi:two-component system, chemotaxis family, sensor kinase CheA